MHEIISAQPISFIGTPLQPLFSNPVKTTCLFNGIQDLISKKGSLLQEEKRAFYAKCEIVTEDTNILSYNE